MTVYGRMVHTFALIDHSVVEWEVNLDEPPEDAAVRVAEDDLGVYVRVIEDDRLVQVTIPWSSIVVYTTNSYPAIPEED